LHGLHGFSDYCYCESRSLPLDYAQGKLTALGMTVTPLENERHVSNGANGRCRESQKLKRHSVNNSIYVKRVCALRTTFMLRMATMNFQKGEFKKQKPINNILKIPL